ncbi:MAG: WXG100 family type VII secretion target [Segniliparus sp.]|uniref:WXG100 family type VII secretion target n=1 Tax=Segniliparus sp. TaxID=2804064 RepID=UPI003F36545A
MSAPFYKVDLAKLQAFIDRLGTFDEKTQGWLNDVSARAERLHSAWSGEAAEAHKEHRERWNQGMAKMRDGLAQLKEQAASDHTRYTGLIEHQQRMWP